jgi:hypothetical protein
MSEFHQTTQCAAVRWHTIQMHKVTVTFERIFDLHRWDESKSGPRHTTFGFIADGKPHYAVSVPNWPTIEVGTTVTAFLREEGNWQSLTGWVNCQTREVSTPNYQRSMFFACISGVLAIFAWIGFFGSGKPVSTSVGSYFSAAFVFALALICLSLANQSYRQRRDTKKIKVFALSQLDELASSKSSGVSQ